MMLLVEISWAQRIWALPFLTVLAPSERYSQQYKLRHKKLIDWARQMMFQVKRWLPTRELVVVADSSFAALELLAAVSLGVMPVHTADCSYIRYTKISVSTRTMKAYSIDFREKIVKAYEQGNTSVRKVASRFDVSKSFVQKLLEMKKTHSSYRTKTAGF